MKLVLPVGRDKMVTAAEFDAESRYGCACSFDDQDNKWLTEDYARSSIPPGWTCGCQCSHGSENNAANFELGFYTP